MADRAVELRRGAGQPQIGEVVTWDGEGWVAQAPMSRRGVIGPTGITEWLRLSTGMEGPDIDIDAAALKIGRGGDSILLFHSGGDPVSEYAATAAGFAAAYAAATAGDLLQIPPRTITLGGGDVIDKEITIAGLSGREGCILTCSAAADTLTVRNKVTFVGLTVRNTNAGNYAAVRIDDADAYVVALLAHFISTGGGDGLNQSHGEFYGVEFLASATTRCAVAVGDNNAAYCSIREGILDSASNAPYACASAGGDATLVLRRVGCRKTGGGTGYHLSQGGTAELWVADCDYHHDKVDGTLSYAAGDRGAYSVESGHASDIEAGVMTRHLPAPGTAGHVARDDGAKWVSAVLDFDDLGGDCDLGDLAGYARGSIIRGGAADWEAYDAKTDGAALVGDGTDIFSTVTPTWLGTHTWGSGLAIMPTDASGQALGAATHRWDLYTQEVVFGGATGANSITVPDDLADALHLSDAGGLEYMRIVSTDAQPATVFNNGEADVDFRVAASRATNALFVQGSSGDIGVGSAPIAPYRFTVYEDTNTTTGILVNNPNVGVGAIAAFFLSSDVYTLQFNVYSDAYSWRAYEDSALISDAPTLKLMNKHATGDIVLYTGGDLVTDERMRITDTGQIGIDVAAPLGQLHVDNPGTVAQPVLYLDQGDIDQKMIEFATTIGVGNAIEAVGGKTLTTTHFIKVTLPGALTRYIPVGTIA